MRNRFVLLSALALLLPAVLRAAAVPKSRVGSENDNGDSVNSLENVDLGCDGAAKCDQDQDAVGAAAAGGIDGAQSTTKNPIINIFQLTNKSCPGFELPPIFNRQKCDTDRDCWPRICCGYGGLNGTRYCRIPLPSWRNDLLKTVSKSLRSNRPRYLQCSPPPPARYDLFPRKCRTTVDCLPDLCCPEAGSRNVCRPPRESILPLVARLSAGAARTQPVSLASWPQSGPPWRLWRPFTGSDY